MRLSETVVRKSRIDGKLYEFIRVIDYYPDRTDVEVTATVWTGHVWLTLHRWASETDI